jgi:hypothetical protein
MAALEAACMYLTKLRGNRIRPRGDPAPSCSKQVGNGSIYSVVIFVSVGNVM